MRNNSKKILFYIYCSIAGAVTLIESPVYANTTSNETILKLYEDASNIVKDQPESAHISSLFTLIEKHADETTILLKICPGYDRLSPEDKTHVKESVIKIIITIYANIFKKHCYSGSHFKIKDTKDMGGKTKIMGTVKNPNTGNNISLNVIMTDNKISDIQVENLSLLNALGKQGQECWRKSNEDPNKFIDCFKKAHG